MLTQILFYVWLFPHSNISVRFIQLHLEQQRALFHGMNLPLSEFLSEFHCTNISLHPFHWDGPLVCFPSVAIMNNGAINILVYSWLMIDMTVPPLVTSF